VGKIDLPSGFKLNLNKEKSRVHEGKALQKNNRRHSIISKQTSTFNHKIKNIDNRFYGDGKAGFGDTISNESLGSFSPNR
jgi:hypothetical protein